MNGTWYNTLLYFVVEDDMQADNFGTFLLKCRKDKKLTQQQLADRLYVSNSTIYKWEKGISMPGLDMYDKLADALEVSAEDLLYCAKNDTAMIVRETKTVHSYDCEKCDFERSADSDNTSTVCADNIYVWIRDKRIRYMAYILSAILVLLVGCGALRIHQNAMKLTIVDEYYQNKSVYNKRSLYNVIIQYEGNFDDEYAYEYADNLRDTYENWFGKVEGIMIQYVDEYKGRENLDNVEYKMVLLPKREAE